VNYRGTIGFDTLPNDVKSEYEVPLLFCQIYPDIPRYTQIYPDIPRYTVPVSEPEQS